MDFVQIVLLHITTSTKTEFPTLAKCVFRSLLISFVLFNYFFFNIFFGLVCLCACRFVNAFRYDLFRCFRCRFHKRDVDSWEIEPLRCDFVANWKLHMHGANHNFWNEFSRIWWLAMRPHSYVHCSSVRIRWKMESYAIGMTCVMCGTTHSAQRKWTSIRAIRKFCSPNRQWIHWKIERKWLK